MAGVSARLRARGLSQLHVQGKGGQDGQTASGRKRQMARKSFRSLPPQSGQTARVFQRRPDKSYLRITPPVPRLPCLFALGAGAFDLRGHCVDANRVHDLPCLHGGRHVVDMAEARPRNRSWKSAPAFLDRSSKDTVTRRGSVSDSCGHREDLPCSSCGTVDNIQRHKKRFGQGDSRETGTGDDRETAKSEPGRDRLRSLSCQSRRALGRLTLTASH